MKSQSFNQLDALKHMTLVVADTGDIQAIKKYQPMDATTNPSLILKASEQVQYKNLLESCIEDVKSEHYRKKDIHSSVEKVISPEKQVIELFSVRLGLEIAQIISGRISTEVDASLSFDCQAMIVTAQRLIASYEEHGLDRSRVLIKLAATWEGIEAARVLETEGINCNLTLIFNFYQALAAAQAKAFLISPFVGRILDWYKKEFPDEDFSGAKDPGVKSVSQIYQHFKHYNYDTVVMGASFRNLEQIQHLAGCDRLTISPELMQGLKDSQASLTQVLEPKNSQSKALNSIISEQNFRWALNQDIMAGEKLAEGIRNFNLDQIKLEDRIHSMLSLS